MDTAVDIVVGDDIIVEICLLILPAGSLQAQADSVLRRVSPGAEPVLQLAEGRRGDEDRASPLRWVLFILCRATAQADGGVLDGFDELFVAGAAAEVAGDGSADL